MKTRYRSRLTGEFFKTEEDVIEHLEGEGIEDAFEAYYEVISLSEEDIKELEDKFKKYCEKNPDDPNCKDYFGEIDDTPDSTEPLEIDSMSEEELKNLARTKIAVDEYMNGQLSDTEEKMLISRLMGMAQDKSVDKKASKKVFEPNSTTQTAFKDYYTNLLRDFQDTSKIACPRCGKLWSTIAEDLKENLAFGDQHKELEGKFPMIRIQHIKASHPSVWKLVSDLFGKGADEMPDDRPSTVPNPEQLSKEELAEKINSDEELRHQFFREWLQRLKNKK